MVCSSGRPTPAGSLDVRGFLSILCPSLRGCVRSLDLSCFRLHICRSYTRRSSCPFLPLSVDLTFPAPVYPSVLSYACPASIFLTNHNLSVTSYIRSSFHLSVPPSVCSSSTRPSLCPSICLPVRSFVHPWRALFSSHGLRA